MSARSSLPRAVFPFAPGCLLRAEQRRSGQRRQGVVHWRPALSHGLFLLSSHLLSHGALPVLGLNSANDPFHFGRHFLPLARHSYWWFDMIFDEIAAASIFLNGAAVFRYKRTSLSGRECRTLKSSPPVQSSLSLIRRPRGLSCWRSQRRSPQAPRTCHSSIVWLQCGAPDDRLMFALFIWYAL